MATQQNISMQQLRGSQLRNVARNWDLGRQPQPTDFDTSTLEGRRRFYEASQLYSQRAKLELERIRNELRYPSRRNPFTSRSVRTQQQQILMKGIPSTQAELLAYDKSIAENQLANVQYEAAERQRQIAIEKMKAYERALKLFEKKIPYGFVTGYTYQYLKKMYRDEGIAKQDYRKQLMNEVNKFESNFPGEKLIISNKKIGGTYIPYVSAVSSDYFKSSMPISLYNSQLANISRQNNPLLSNVQPFSSPNKKDYPALWVTKIPGPTGLTSKMNLPSTGYYDITKQRDFLNRAGLYTKNMFGKAASGISNLDQAIVSNLRKYTPEFNVGNISPYTLSATQIKDLLRISRETTSSSKYNRAYLSVADSSGKLDKWESKIKDGFFDGTPQEYVEYSLEYEDYLRKLNTYNKIKESMGKLGYTEVLREGALGLAAKGSEYVPTSSGEAVYRGAQLYGGVRAALPAASKISSLLTTSIGAGRLEALSVIFGVESAKAFVNPELTPESRVTGLLTTGLSAFSGAKFLFGTRPAIIIRAGEEIPLRQLTQKELNFQLNTGRIAGNKVIFNSKYNPNERIEFIAVSKPVKIGDNLYSYANIKLRQYIPGTYAKAGQSRVSDLLFKREIVQVRKPTLIEITNTNPIIVNEKGLIVNKPIFEAVKVSTKGKSRFTNVAELKGRSQEFGIDEFRNLPKSLKEQILRTYELRFGVPISESRFIALYKDSNIKFSVSAVEGTKQFKVSVYTEPDKVFPILKNKVIQYRIPKTVKGTSRNLLFDETKLEMSSDLLPYDIFRTKTAFRNVNVPKTMKIGSIRVTKKIKVGKNIRKMKGKLYVFKETEDALDDKFSGFLVPKLKQVKRLDTKKTANTLIGATKTAADILLPKKAASLKPLKSTVTNTNMNSILLGSKVSALSLTKATQRITQKQPSQYRESLNNRLVQRQPSQYRESLNNRVTQRQPPRLKEKLNDKLAQRQLSSLRIQRIIQRPSVQSPPTGPRIPRPTNPLRIFFPPIKRTNVKRVRYNVRRRKAKNKYQVLPTIFEQISLGSRRGKRAKRDIKGFEAFRFY